MNFKKLSGDLVLMKNSKSLLVLSSPTVNLESKTVKPEVCFIPKKEVIPGVGFRKTQEQSKKKLLTVTGDVTDVA